MEVRLACMRLRSSQLGTCKFRCDDDAPDRTNQFLLVSFSAVGSWLGEIKDMI